MSIDLKIELDAKDVMDFFRRAPDKLVSALSYAIKSSAFFIEQQAKLRTPRFYDPIGPSIPRRTYGRLQSSIYTRVSRLYATVSTNTNYALYVHHGTRFMRPRPFMLQGLRAAEYDIRRVFNSEITKALT